MPTVRILVLASEAPLPTACLFSGSLSGLT
uniref:Uncharacterized protein n=1 Tax=Anguilla anguilla TaxID=7936 RepID=A0A0E9TVY8_ANGAN